MTGIRVFRGQEYGDGDWPVIVDRGTWSEVQDRRAYRAAATDNRASRFYLLRGLVMCKKCGTHMAGNCCKEPSYMCARHNKIGPAYAPGGSTPHHWKPSSPMSRWSCSPSWM